MAAEKEEETMLAPISASGIIKRRLKQINKQDRWYRGVEDGQNDDGTPYWVLRQRYSPPKGAKRNQGR